MASKAAGTHISNEHTSRLVHVSPSPNSQNSDFEVLSMADVDGGGGGGGGGGEASTNVTEKKIRFASVVYSNPLGGEDTTLELNVVSDQSGRSSSTPDDDSRRESVASPTTTTFPSRMDEAMLQEVLDTRPTLQLGRNMSMRFRSPSAFTRRPRATTYGSLSERKSRSATVGGREDLFKSASLPADYRKGSTAPVLEEDPSAITLEDIEEMVWDGEEEEQGFTFKEGAKYRQSTLRLKERIDMQRESNLRETIVAVRDSPWDRFKHVKWPKFKSRVKVIFSWSLWKGHMKEIEGHFGTAVVSYFIFLRFIFLLNLLIFAMWFGLVVIPGALYLAFNDPPNTPSQLACAYSTDLLPERLCSTDNPANASDIGFNFSLVVHYQLASSGNYSCDLPSSFLVQSCGFGETLTFGDSFQYRVADREGGETISVSTIRPSELECEFERDNLTITELRLCSTDINPSYQWYEYIVDFALGQGLYNDTILFYGRYGNVTVSGGLYSLPLAYLLMTGVIYALSVVLLVYKLGHAYNESYTQFSSKRKINFSNKLFTAWDFNITHPNTAKLQRVHIRTDFEEELSDFDKRCTKRSKKELAKVIVIRIFVNLFTFVILIGASVAIYYAALYGLENQSTNGLSFEGLVLPVVITTLNLVLPFFFSFLALIERFKTQSGEIKMTLVRAIMVRMASLIVLVITLFLLISCSQQVEDVVTSTSTTCNVAFSAQALNDIVLNSTTTINECPVCWETFVGQELYKLGLANFVVSIASTIAVETSRNIASRIKFKGLGEKLGKGNFNIAKSILDLIYTQALLWLGFFFSPMLPVVIMSTTFILFYVKKYSLMTNLTPNKRGAFRAARTNFLFILIMLVSLFLILVPIGYVVANFVPSQSCGPFRGASRIHSILGDNIDNLACAAQQFFDFIASIGFIFPLLVLLLLIIYSQYVILKARKERFQLIKKQLVLEGANVTHIVGKLDGVLQKMAEQKAMVTESMTNPQEQPHLRQRIMDIRNSVTDEGISEAPL